MSRMLVAYEKCGCAAMALVEPSDPAEADRFKADAENDGLEVREENRESIGHSPCAAHASRGKDPF